MNALLRTSSIGLLVAGLALPLAGQSDPSRDQDTTTEVLTKIAVDDKGKDALGPNERAISVIVERVDDANGFRVKLNGREFTGATLTEIEERALADFPGRPVKFLNEKHELLRIAPPTMLGVLLEPVDGALASQLRLEPRSAVLITETYQELPAVRAGVRPFDVIVELNGARPVTQEVVARVLGDSAPGDRLNLIAIREGAPVEIEVELEAYRPGLMKSPGELDELAVLHMDTRSGDAFSKYWTVYSEQGRADLDLILEAETTDQWIPVRREQRQLEISGVVTPREIELDRVEGLLEMMIELQKSQDAHIRELRDRIHSLENAIRASRSDSEE
ncbi:MAG: PDZ domain-containing protein [Phycisphaerales bacterium]